MNAFVAEALREAELHRAAAAEAVPSTLPGAGVDELAPRIGRIRHKYSPA